MTLREAGRRSIILRIAWLICLVAVIVGSLLPAESAPMRALDKLAINDKVQHLLAYALLAFLPAIHERRRTVALLIFLAPTLGVFLEYGQLYSPGRSFDVRDMLANAAGVGIGAAIGLALRRFLPGTGGPSQTPQPVSNGVVREELT